MLLGKQPFTPHAETLEAARLHERLQVLFAPHICWVFPISGSDKLLLAAQTTLMERYDCAEAWMKAVRKELDRDGVKASASAGWQPVVLSDLGRCCERLELGMKKEQRLRSTVMIDIERHINSSYDADIKLPMFAELIRQRQKEQFMLKLSERLQKLKSDNVRFLRLEDLTAVIAKSFAEAASELPEAAEELASGPSDMRALLTLPDYEQFSQSLLEWCRDGMDMLVARSRRRSEQLFQMIDDYVSLHLYSQLSIGDLALKFHVSPSYISRI